MTGTEPGQVGGKVGGTVGGTVGREVGGVGGVVALNTNAIADLFSGSVL